MYIGVESINWGHEEFNPTFSLLPCDGCETFGAGGSFGSDIRQWKRTRGDATLKSSIFIGLALLPNACYFYRQ